MNPNARWHVVALCVVGLLAGLCCAVSPWLLEQNVGVATVAGSALFLFVSAVFVLFAFVECAARGTYHFGPFSLTIWDPKCGLERPDFENEVHP